MEGDFFQPVLGLVFLVVSSVLAVLLGYRIVARRRSLKLAESQKKPSLRLRPEVAAWIDRSPEEVLLVLENVGGVDALEVDIQARWKLADQEVEALEEIEKYRLPLAVLSAAKKTTFELKFPEAQSPQLFLRLSWKNRAGRVEKRSLALQT